MELTLRGWEAQGEKAQGEGKVAAPSPQHIEHPFGPIYDERSRVLVLGTMPSPASRSASFYYGHPRNRFWAVVASLFDEPVALTTSERAAQALRLGIALWDVLASCTIVGAQDASIRDVQPNDVAGLLARTSISPVFCNGAKAHELYVRHCEQSCGVRATKLPSTSPANASWSLTGLVEAWEPLAAAVRAQTE